MKIATHTSLSSLDDFPAALREQLRSLWIESVEEYLSLCTAVEEPLITSTRWVDSQTIAGSRSLAISRLAAGRADALRERRPGGKLGCQIEEQWLQAYAATGRVGAVRQRIADGFDKPYPPAVRLLDRLRPVKNQGSRGTCVAFGSVALREFLVGTAPELSEQFLYWGCKELDGYPGPGTYLLTAASALAQYGVCTAAKWPYNSNQTNSESQAPPPDGAKEDALRFRMAHERVEPTLIEQYKHFLAGDASRPGMPVVIATLVFDSWFMSPETHRTGKITMPLPGEPPGAGGHAWCVVGYVDDPTVPGGGYFILRNSWGAGWAADSPEKPGHALMPFAYVERFAVEAFTGPTRLDTPPPATEEVPGADPVFRPYLSRLPEKAADVEGKTLVKGAIILANPGEPAAFLEDSPANREKFRQRDFTWTDHLRRQFWFKTPAHFPDEAKAELEKIRAEKAKFIGAIDINLEATIGSACPPEFLPAWRAKCPLIPPARFGTVEKLESRQLSESFLTLVCDHSGGPRALGWGAEWKPFVARCNAIRAHSLRAAGANLLAVTAFVCPFHFSLARPPEIGCLTVALATEIHTLVLDWIRQTGRHPDHVYLSIGCHGTLPPELQQNRFATSTVMLSAYTAPDQFEHRVTSTLLATKALRALVEQFKPETLQDRVARIKTKADRDMVLNGWSSLESLASDLALRRSQVLRAFLKLQEQDPKDYRIVKRGADYRLVKPAGGRPTITKMPDSVRRAFVAQILALCVSTAISWFVLEPLKEQVGRNAVGFLAIVTGSLIGKLVEKIILEKFSE